jgi:hypothetical protein
MDSQQRPLIPSEATNNNGVVLQSNTKRSLIGLMLFGFVLCFFMIASSSTNTSSNLVIDEETKMQCPSSPAWFHAQCSMTFQINDFMCRDVKEEIERRILGKDNWMDPKSHPGKYQLLDSEQDSTLAQRTTGDGSNYVDKFMFTYSDVEGQGCLVTGCSVAQSPSKYDYSTNYCNMHNLICGKQENCKVSRHDMRPPKEQFLNCPYHDVSQCTR